ncbi:MAG: hypothetical protein ACRCV0_04395 [Brevinema sp.]
MKTNLLLLLFVLNPLFIFSVETKFIHSKHFENVWLWQLSNTSVQPQSYISLPNETKQLFTTSELLWSAEKINNTFYLGTGEGAKIIKLSKNYQEETIYSNANKSLIGAIKPFGDGILAGVSPESELVQFDNNHQIITNISISNTYIWDIVPHSKTSAYILTGTPAEIYQFSSNTLEHIISLSNEEHLIRGLYEDGSLWVLGETALYNIKDKKATAIASFDGTASGIVYQDKKFYIVLSESIKNIEDPKTEIVQSHLISVTMNGIVEKLFSTQGFYFTGIGVFKDYVVVGGDQFGFYAMYDRITKKTELANLGMGKIIDIFNENNQLVLLTSDQSGLWSIENKLASEGSFISEVYDTGNISSWGKFDSSISTPPNTSISFFVQSGVTKDTSLWADWQPVTIGATIPVQNARFIRFKATLTSDNKAKPYIYEIKFPYTQQNLSPVIENVSIVQSNKDTMLSWTANDPNNDTLEYDVYLADDGMQKIKITTQPIQGTNFLIMNERFPSGYKRITLVASDKPSNATKTALTSEYHSIPILIDNESPIIADIRINKKNKTGSVRVIDQLSVLKQVIVIFNGTKQVSLLPNDGIFDSKEEEFNFEIPLEETTFVQINAVDTAQNIATKGITVIP